MHPGNFLAVVEAGLALLAIGAADYISGREASLWALHLLPVAYCSWNCGWRAALGCAIGATALLVLVGVRVGHPYSSDVYWYLALASAAATYFVLSCTLYRLRKASALCEEAFALLRRRSTRDSADGNPLRKSSISTGT